MYFRVLCLLCAYLTITYADTESDEAKYIDLLPEEEKQEFLNRITKRIVAEIRSRSHPGKTSIEVSDERLNENSAYIQKIMDEESETFKNNRRHKSETNAENEDNVEYQVKPLHDIEEQGNTDILDISIAKNKRRTKKDTYKDSKQMSYEIKANNEDKVSAVPVSLLYDDENDLKKTIADNNAVGKEDIKENFDETVLVDEELDTEKSVTESLIPQDSIKIDNETDIKNNSREIESREISQIHNKQESFPAIEVIEIENVTDVSQTVINDYETLNKTFPDNNEAFILKATVENKSREITSKEIGTDSPNSISQMPITDLREMQIESTTDNVYNIFSFGIERDITDKSLLAENVNKISNFSESNYISTQNNTITDFPTLINDVIISTDKKIINDTVNGTNQNVIKTDTKENLQPATPPVVDFRIELTTSEPPLVRVNEDKIKFKNDSNSNSTRNSVIENENINKVNVKTILRKGSDDLYESVYEYDDRSHLNLKNSDSLPNDENNNNHYNVFEISNKKPPFEPTEQISIEFAEEPHYIPVYNYEPQNAFYSAYNHYGPNFNDDGKISKPKVSHYRGDGDKFNKQKIVHDYINRSQRNFKPYITNHIYHKPRSITYQSKIVPVWKQKFPVINFNPNDYLDMDYYLGRSNDASRYNDIGIKRKPQNINYKYVASKDNSKDIIDPDPSAEQQNIKENIKNLRHKLFIQKYGDKVRGKETHDKHRENLKTKFQGNKKILDPMLRGLDDTLLIFLPKEETKHTKKYDDIDKNIAVDYYFSRMNSEELPLFNDSRTYISDESLPDKELSIVPENNFKNDKKISEEHDQLVTEEKHVHIPLKQDHVLKIDIGVQNGNKVDVIFRNIKNPERSKFDIYLQAYLDVLKDMIEHDNKGLMLYDWLGTTVDVQSAIAKLLDLTKNLLKKEQMHYSDYELIKYILNVFKSSKTLIKEASRKPSKVINKGNEIPDRSGKRKMPKVSSKMKTNLERPIDILNKVLKQVKEMQQLNIDMDDDVLGEFEIFLTELQTCLYEIHGAIKQIATVTKFRKQSWFLDVKALYLTPVNKNTSLRLLLHLASSKLFGLIEESAKNGLEDNFIIFAQNHKAEVDRTREEFIFVLRLLNEINKLKN